MSVLFVAFALPPYLGFDASQARIPTRDDYLAHYPLLVAHILFGSVALLAGCLQVWPWFRARYRIAHRVAGRIYLFGALPGGLAVLAIAPVSSTGFVASVGNTLLGVLWLGTSIAGYRAARRRRFAEHRIWMVRAFALTISIVVERLWLVAGFLLFVPRVDTLFGGDREAMYLSVSGAAVWLSWVVNLLIVEWWVLRRSSVRGRPSARLG